MGIFDKLFSGEQKSDRSDDDSRNMHKESWVFFFSPISEEHTGSIMVDIGLNAVAPVKTHPRLLNVAVEMNSPREDGLSSSEESGRLNEINDSIEQAVKDEHDGIFAGRVNGASKLRMYFYLRDGSQPDSTVESVMKNYPDYRFKSSLKDDPDWETYLGGLYPSQAEMQSIQNRNVIEQLMKNGDKLEKARPVDHWIYFSSENDRETFLDAITAKGFEIVNKEKVESDTGRPYEVQISRTDRVDPESVDTYVLELWQIAQDCNGDYDGWETYVVRD